METVDQGKPVVETPGQGHSWASLQRSGDRAVESLRRFLMTGQRADLGPAALAVPEARLYLCDPQHFSVDESEELIRRSRLVIPGLEAKLAASLNDASYTVDRGGTRASRLLRILETSKNRAVTVPALRVLLHSPYPKVRSKSALLIGKIIHNTLFPENCRKDPDPRTLANAIESLWGLRSMAARDAFRKATLDHHNRVAGNGIYGLYLAGDRMSVVLASGLAAHHDPNFRVTAAWLIGAIKDERFHEDQTRLLHDPDERVRQTALHFRLDANPPGLP